MCGRFDRHRELEAFAGLIDGLVLDGAPRIAPSYNVAPSQDAAVVIVDGEGRRCLAALSWGLVPAWSAKPTLRRPINARIETVTEKPMFRSAIKQGRCVVPCDGYYEWAATADGKQPYYFYRDGNEPFFLAGIREHNTRLEPAPLDTFCVLTRPASDVVGGIHHRMPVVLAADAVDAWLNPAVSAGEAREFADHVGEDEMAFHPVSTFVNTPANDSPRCTERLA